MKLHYFFNLSFIFFITNMICFNSVSSFGFISKLSNMLRTVARSVRMTFLAIFDPVWIITPDGVLQRKC